MFCDSILRAEECLLPTRATRTEIELAFEWWKKFPEAKLIMSTGDNQELGVTNAKVMADYAVSLGLPRENVIEEDRSRTTYTSSKCHAERSEASPTRWEDPSVAAYTP